MKKIIILLLIIINPLIMISCNNSIQTTSTAPITLVKTTNLPTQILPIETHDANCKLFIDGKEIPNPYINIDHGNKVAEIPLVTITEALGGTVDWQSNSLLILKYEDRTYSLDVSQEDFGIIEIPGSTYYVRKLVDKEVIIDSTHGFYIIGEFFEKFLRVDYENAIIYIDDFPPEHPWYENTNYLLRGRC